MTESILWETKGDLAPIPNLHYFPIIPLACAPNVTKTTSLIPKTALPTTKSEFFGRCCVRIVAGPEHPIPINFWGTLIFTGPGKNIEICACLNLEVLGVPEGLVHSIGILEAPAVFLARRWPKS